MSQVSYPNTTASQSAAIGGAAANVATALVPGKRYEFTANTSCWIKQGAAPTATAGAGSLFVPAGRVVPITGSRGAIISAIQDAAPGRGAVTEVDMI